MVFDLHTDVMVDVVRRRRLGERRVLTDVHLPRWRQGRVAAACLVIGGDPPSLNPLGQHRPLESALHMLDALLQEVAESRGAIVIARNAADVRAAQAAGQFSVLIGLEGAAPLGGDLGVFRSLVAMGLRHIGLTWNYRNAAADGVSESDTRGGLTQFGRELVREAMRLGVIVDASHLSSAGFWDVLDIATRPPAVTHACAAGLLPHPRNLTDEQLRALADKGGVIGLALYPGFLSADKATLDDALDHLIHLLDVAGPDHVALGPDFIDFAPEIMALDLGNLPGVYGDDHAFPPGIENTTQLPNLLNGLRERGVSEEVIAKVSWGNALRLVSEATGPEAA